MKIPEWLVGVLFLAGLILIGVAAPYLAFVFAVTVAWARAELWPFNKKK